MPLRLRSAGGGSVQLNSPVALATDVSVEVPGYAGAKLLTDKTPGSVLQVVQAFKSDTWSSATTSWIDITGLSLQITPKSATSKFLVQAVLGRVSASGSSWYSMAFRLVRNGGQIGVGDAAGSRPQAGTNITHNDAYYDGNGSMMYLDSPNTLSPITYGVQTMGHGVGTILLNYSESNGDLATGYASRNSSNLVVMEIAA